MTSFEQHNAIVYSGTIKLLITLEVSVLLLVWQRLSSVDPGCLWRSGQIFNDVMFTSLFSLSPIVIMTAHTPKTREKANKQIYMFWRY